MKLCRDSARLWPTLADIASRLFWFLFTRFRQPCSPGLDLVESFTTISLHTSPPLANLARGFRSPWLATLQQGHLKDYRLCEEVWTFRVRNATLKLDNSDMLDVDKVKIVACKMADSTSK